MNSDTDTIFDYARTLTSFISEHLINTNTMHDDACDDLDACMTMLDLCSRALRADDRDRACNLLATSFDEDAPADPHDNDPINFDPIHLHSYDDLAADCPRPPRD